jgi:hypothetical protein
MELNDTLVSFTCEPRIFSKRCFSSTGVNCVDRKVKSPPPDVLAPEQPARNGATAAPTPRPRAVLREMVWERIESTIAVVSFDVHGSPGSSGLQAFVQ